MHSESIQRYRIPRARVASNASLKECGGSGNITRIASIRDLMLLLLTSMAVLTSIPSSDLERRKESGHMSFSKNMQGGCVHRGQVADVCSQGGLRHLDWEQQVAV
jgi:hypothetical protein